MAAQPASTVPTISPAEMQILISRAGLVLNPGQMADLVLAWRQVAGLIASIPQERKLADDMALTFRLPSPKAAITAARAATKAPAKEAPHAASKPVARKAPHAAPKPAAKPARKGKSAAAPAKAKTKRKAPARRSASRGR
jgi:hypothetical protein